MQISITVVVLAAMTVAMVITALIAFLPTHTAGIDSVRDSVSILRQNAIGRVVHGIQLFFRVPAAQINTLQVAFESGADIFMNDDQVMKMMCGALRDERGILLSACAYTQTSIMCCNTQFGTPIGGVVHSPNTSTAVYVYDMEKLEYATPLRKFFDISWDPPSQWNFFERTFPPDASANQKRWIDAHGGYDTIAFAATVGLVNASGLVDRRLATYLFPPQLESFMQTLGLTENARVVAVDATKRLVFANNWGEKTQVLFSQWADLTLFAYQRMGLKTLSNMTDKTVGKVVAELGGEDAFYALNDTYATTLFDGEEKLFVDVKTFRDEYGLNVRVLVVMPERDFTKTIVDRQKTTIGTVVGTLVAMLLLSVAFAVLLTRPLKRLGNRMYKTARLEEDEDDEPSLLSEIADMQGAYSTMKAELLRMKSFLPQSLVDAGSDDHDDDDEEGAAENRSAGVSPSEGNLTPGRRSPQHSQTDENRSTASSMHSKSSRGARAALGTGAGVGLNMTRSVHKRRVAVACVNLVGFHTFAKGGNASTMTTLQSRYLTIVNKHVRDHKGFVDSFHGDKVFASFGAVSLVTAPGKRAMLCCGNAASELSDTGLMPPCTAGIAAGMASVGNMGIDSMIRFNVVGPVVAEAAGMERLARLRISGDFDANDDTDPVDVPVRASDSSLIVATSDAVQDGELEVNHAFFDIASLGSKVKKLVAYVGGAKSMATDEWMYQLEKSQKDDIYHVCNNVFRAVSHNDLATARERLQSVPGQGKLRQRLVDLCNDEGQPRHIGMFV